MNYELRIREKFRIQNSEFRDKVIASEAKQSRNRHCENGLPRPNAVTLVLCHCEETIHGRRGNPESRALRAGV